MLGALTAIALAGTAAAEPAALTPRRAVLDLILTQIVEGEPVLVGVRGERPESWRVRVERVRPELPLRFVALDDEQPAAVAMALALGQAGLRCGVSLTPAGPDRWDLGRWGTCGSEGGVLVQDSHHLTRDELHRHALDLASGERRRVVVAAWGEGTAPMVATLFQGVPAIWPVQIARQSDPLAAMPSALAQADAGCGLLVRPDPAGTWRVDEVGDCGPGPSTGTLVARAMAGDPRPPEQIARELSLRIVDSVGPADRGPDWSLQEGSGAPLTSLQAALQLGDEAGIAHLTRLQRSRALPALSLGLAGAVLQITGLAQMIAGFDQARSTDTYTARTDGLQRGWTGVVVTTAGLMVVSGAPLLRFSAADRLRRPDRFYDRDRAEALVRAYDQDLARELGVEEPWGSDSEGAPEEGAP